MNVRRRVMVTVLIVMLVSACAGGGAGSSPSTTTSRAPTTVTSATPATSVLAPPESAAPVTTEQATTTSAPVEVTTTARPGCEMSPTRDLLEARRTPASPYFVHHPTVSDSDTPTVMFLPGGTSGTREAAERVWANYLQGEGVDDFRIVIPYAVDFDLYDDKDRILAIVDEVLDCFGGDPGAFHIAGYSRGGQIAFDLMLRRPDLFATVLGAPGEFLQIDPDEFHEKLAGKAVFNGVGENDEEWLPPVTATHEALVQAGVESVYVVFPGEGHRLSAEFDETIFFEFWASH